MMTLRYISRQRDDYGKLRTFVRRNGRRIALNEKPGTPAFHRAYAAALEKLAAPRTPRAPAVKSLGWLADRYFDSVEFTGLDPVSQRRRRAVIIGALKVLHKATQEPMEKCPLRSLNAAKVKAIRDDKAGLPGAANNRLKYLSAMFGWGVEAGHLQANPVREVRRIKRATEGFHTWSVEEVAKFEAHWPIGSKPRLALALLLFLGVRRGDVVRLAPEMVKDGVLSFVPAKTRYRRVALSHKPVLPELAAIIAASPVGRETFLETSFGKPFTAPGFSNWFRAQCDAAGLTECSAHGLRKAGATIAAENGATVHALMALYDWQNVAQATPYTAAADRKRLAAEAAPLLARRVVAASA